MSPGQRRYIEGRLTKLEERMAWMLPLMVPPGIPEWIIEEYPQLQAQAEVHRARLANG